MWMEVKAGGEDRRDDSSGVHGGGVEYLLLVAYGLVVLALFVCGIWNLLQQHRPTTTNVSILPGQHHVMDLWTEHAAMWTCAVCGHDNMCQERLAQSSLRHSLHRSSSLCLMCGSPSRHDSSTSFPSSASPPTHPTSPPFVTPQLLSASHRRDWTRRVVPSTSAAEGPHVEVWEASARGPPTPPLGRPLVGYIAVCVSSPTHACGRLVPQTTSEFNAAAVASLKTNQSHAPVAPLRHRLPFPQKYHMWLTQVAKAKERYRHRLVYVRASRQTTSVVPLAAERLMALSPEELHFPLSIRFAGEPGVDAGGLEREWYNTVATALFDPAMGYFVQVEHTSKSMLIHPHASPKWFRGIGRFLGRALFDGHPIPARMNGVLYKQLLGVPYSVDDIQFIDASVYRSLKWMLSQQSPDDCVCTLEALELDFTVMEQTLDERGRPTGTSRVVDLKPYGRQCRVTNANVAEYVELYVHWLCLTRVSACVAALRRGLQDVLPPSMLLLDMMDHKELELLLCGVQEIDVTDWKKYTFVIASKAAVDPADVVGWFWDVVAAMAHDRQVKLLQYVTGSVCVPLQGFQALTNRDGSICHFTLRIVSLDEAAYPVAHTCSNRLDLPRYEDQATLRHALDMVTAMDVTGFSTA
ncbi:hypothetical protein H310_06592 [Aphanomyces invadans]|uniref:HECT-type E3 ubiquitin transferase n=1 Tax=Aphanomyces invadans TaxID=157072 RepID=A0A024U3Y5_9STRA|nr:hypothetical protein H310_06592 [Aphanomyces invadans]ETW00939.1 hypothetical protein H310_06592 [Aphanomyces invadans]|eukprot:XP_008869937.1 hypothetical protein H310_06592 [Aphanomyces invadans]